MAPRVGASALISTSEAIAPRTGWYRYAGSHRTRSPVGVFWAVRSRTSIDPFGFGPEGDRFEGGVLFRPTKRKPALAAQGTRASRICWKGERRRSLCVWRTRGALLGARIAEAGEFCGTKRTFKIRFRIPC